MTSEIVDLSQIDLQSDLTPVVGWRSGSRLKMRQITAGSSVTEAFRGIIGDAVEDLSTREGAAWTPDADLTPETYLVIPVADLGPAPVLASEHGPQTFAESLLSAETLEHLNPTGIPAADLVFYAYVLGDTPGQRTAFLRRSNPRRGLKRGRLFTYLSDSLERIEAPIFAFDGYVDLVFTSEHVLILSQTAFAALFRGQDALASQVPAWANDLHGHTPMTEEGLARLTAKAQRDTRVRARLEAITRRGHLATVSTETLRQAMTAAGMDPDELLDSNGQLVLEEESIPQVLHLLNEDLFSGALTATGFRADKKAAR